MEAKPYDRSTKWLIAHASGAMLRLGGLTDVASWKALANEAVQPRQTPDGLLEVRRTGQKEPNWVLFEVFTYPDNAAAAQLLDDLMLVYQSKRAVPDFIVFVLKEKGNVRIADRIAVASPAGLARFEASWRVVEAWTLSGDDLLASGDPAAVPWATLGTTALPPAAFLTECRRVVEENAPPTEVEPLLTVSEIFAGLQYGALLSRAIFERGRSMIESPVLDEWAEEFAAETTKKLTLQTLTKRFGSVPHDIEVRLRAIPDTATLEPLNWDAFACPDLNTFRAKLPT